MRWIADYFKQVFCKHRWSQVERHDVLNDHGNVGGAIYHSYCQDCMRHKKWKVMA